MTQPSQANPHRIFFWHRFQPPVRNPQETPGKPSQLQRKPSQLPRKPGGNPPLTALTHPLRPYKAFLSPCIARFVFFCAQTQTPRRLHSIGRGNTFRASQLDACAEDVMPPGTQGPLAWHQPSPLLTSRHLWDSNPRGGDPVGLAGRCLSRSAKVSSAKICKSAGLQSRHSRDCQSLLLVLPPHLTALPALTDS